MYTLSNHPLIHLLMYERLPARYRRVPGMGCSRGGGVLDPLIWMQSRCVRFSYELTKRCSLTGEIASRLRIRYQAAQWRGGVAERAQHAMEISGLPGFDRRRRAGRERWWLGHRVHTALFARKLICARRARMNPMPQPPPFSRSSSPPIEPGHS